MAAMVAPVATVVTAVAAAVVVTVPLFTVGFRHPGDWFFPYKAISYWWGQHSIERVGGPPWYHLPRLGLYEFLPIIAGLAWAARRGKKVSEIVARRRDHAEGTTTAPAQEA
jgi:hypothetical protein